QPAGTVRAPLRLPPRLRDLAVLVVDDNATNRRILKDMLTNWQMQPTVADSGTAALTALRQGARSRDPFGLIILDVMMPEMDGFELVERIKSEPAFAALPILILT